MKKIILPILIILAIIAIIWLLVNSYKKTRSVPEEAGLPKITSRQVNTAEQEKISNLVLPIEALVLPIVWGDLGQRLVAEGVIDRTKFENLYGGKNQLDQALKLIDQKEQKLTMNRQNANILLNFFWAFGLANKNLVLDEGTIIDPKYGGADRFTSTGGWTLSTGSPMDHYSKHEFIELSSGKQALIEKVSKNIYRPCCNNSTFFPDCNHGMAMLGLLELMADQGVSEDEMYKVALRVNSYWFPSQYLTIAQYFNEKNIPFDKVDPKLILGEKFSSSSGFQAISQKVQNLPGATGNSCGV